MADKPIYYGGKGSSPMYYGSSRPGYPAYGGTSPMYYGAGRTYGGVYGGNPSGGTQDDGSLVGTVTLSRMMRVVSQRWLSVFVFLLVGLIISFAVYRISPTIYEARSEFTMDMRRASGAGNGVLADATPDFGNNYAEVFNTRISDWRSDKIVTKILEQYRANNPSSTVSDEEIVGVLVGSQLELQRNSRIITISARSKVPKLCADLANAYAEAIEAFTDEENKARCDKYVSQIHANVEKKRRETDKIAGRLLEFRTANKVDNLRSSRDTISQGLSKTTADILTLESEETQLIEWEKMLAAVQKDPATYGNLSTGVPRATEIATEFRAYQDADGEYQKLLFAYTENHPEVISAKKVLALSKQRFLDAAARALLTGRSTLQVVRNQLANLRAKQDDLRNELASVEQRIVLAESGLGQLEAEYGVATRVLEGLILDENKARMEAESNNEIVRVGRPANVPTKPVLPNPLLIFGAGVFMSLAAGFLFVLILDNLEDTIVNLGDIENRLALKVLAVLPHVRRKKRQQVARFAVDEKYSQFSEAVAGLRNLLDSPRYDALSHCLLVISTMPGEGKTITSSSLAITYAQAGKKTLHVDFDMRRPRLAKIWNLELTQETSFSNVMQEASEKHKPDFEKLINRTEVDNLHVIASLDPDGVSPSQILGSSAVADFFDWARFNYDRVIIDSPPYGIVGDVVSLAVAVDSVIIMCCPDRTHFKPIRHCARTLTEAGANILGVVVNDVDYSNIGAFSVTHSHSYRKYGYGSYYYGYGYGGKRRSGKAAEDSDNDSPAENEGKSEYTDEE